MMSYNYSNLKFSCQLFTLMLILILTSANFTISILAKFKSTRQLYKLESQNIYILAFNLATIVLTIAYIIFTCADFYTIRRRNKREKKNSKFKLIRFERTSHMLNMDGRFEPYRDFQSYKA
jgi:predicted membrane protein